MTKGDPWYTPDEITVTEANSDPLAPLRAANAQSAYEWLARESPVHAAAIAEALKNGVTPDEIFRFMLRDRQGDEFARLCRQAARHLTQQD